MLTKIDNNSVKRTNHFSSTLLQVPCRSTWGIFIAGVQMVRILRHKLYTLQQNSAFNTDTHNYCILSVLLFQS